MATLTTAGLIVPDQILDPWLLKVRGGSTVAALSRSIPMKFGQGHSMTFDIGEAEYVGEGANKGPSSVTNVTKTVKPFKFHKTLRWTEEVQWADADYQLSVVSQLLNLVQPALSRALDYGVLHGINPTGGAVVPAMTDRLSATTNKVVKAAQKDYAIIDAADLLVLGSGYNSTDVALDPSWAGAFTTARNATSEMKLFPNFTLGTAVSELNGHRASVSSTVSAVGVAAVATTILGFVGDFSTIGWGVQRQIGMEMIKYGDPDGQGDLKRNNQVAFRMEIVYGWGIADPLAVTKVTTV